MVFHSGRGPLGSLCSLTLVLKLMLKKEKLLLPLCKL